MSDLRITQLDNGLTVATERVPGARSVAIGAWLAVGARDEPDDKAGVSHFLEHLLFKGTSTRSSRDIATAFERVGGDLNAFTTKEFTAFYCRVPPTIGSSALGVLGDVVTRPLLLDTDIESERSVILEELAMDDDNPEDLVHQDLARLLFPSHPLGRETAGHRHTVAEITPDDVRAFFTRWYTAGNTVVSVAGDLDHDEVLGDVTAAFAAMAPGGERPARDQPSLAEPSTVDLPDDIEQAQIAVGMRTFGRGDPRREALDVLNHALGGGPSSRLFEEIRERRGLAYTVYSTPSSYSDAGALTVYAGTQKENTDLVMELFDAELDRMADGGVTGEELEIAQGYLTGSYLMGLEDTGSRMSRTGGQLVTSGTVRPVEEQLDRWRAVGLADVRDLAAAVLADRWWAVLRPDAD